MSDNDKQLKLDEYYLDTVSQITFLIILIIFGLLSIFCLDYSVLVFNLFLTSIGLIIDIFSALTIHAKRSTLIHK